MARFRGETLRQGLSGVFSCVCVVLAVLAIAFCVSVTGAGSIQEAYAVDLGLSSSNVLAQGTSAAPSALSLGREVTGYTYKDTDGEQWYQFTTTNGHSAYEFSLISTSNKKVYWELQDANGNKLDSDSTTTNTTEKVLLSQNSTYKVCVYTYNSTSIGYRFKVSEVPSIPQFSSLGKDKNFPYGLTLGRAINSQFDERGGSQDQWFTFKTTARHSAYAVRLFSRMDDQKVYWVMYDEYGNKVASNSTTTVDTENVLLSANSTYTLNLYAYYNAKSGFPSYELTVSEVPSNPQYSSLGKDKNNPYALKLSTPVSSQFDDRGGSQDQWFTFSTTSRSYPYVFDLTSKMPGRKVYWTLYDYYGNRVGSDSTTTTSSSALQLKPNMQYRVLVYGYYNGDSGFTSYQFCVSEAYPSKVTGVVAKGGKTSVKVSYNASSPSSGYQIAYKKQGARSWSYANSASRSCMLKSLKPWAKYQVKVRGFYDNRGTYYYGAWSAVKTVTVTAKVGKSSSVKVTPGKKSMKVTFKKGSFGLKSQVAYRMAGKSKWTTKTTSKASLKISKLKGNKKYQVRVRSFAKYGGKTYSGAWSGIKTVKVKR